MNPPTNIPPTLSQQVQACTGNPEFLAAIQSIYGKVDEQIAALGACCRGCGGCCNFELAGHRLYASTGEIALLMRTPPAVSNPSPLRCPYQLDTRCCARDNRPLGCRVYFCDKKISNSSQDIYENSHFQLRLLHQKYYLPYTYTELTSALMQLSFQ